MSLQGGKSRSKGALIDMRAFTAPKVYKKPGSDSRAAQILDAVGIGVQVDITALNQEKPKRLRSIATKRKKGNLHTYNGPYTVAEFFQLMRDKEDVAKTVLVLAGANTATAPANKEYWPKSNKNASNFILDVLYAVLVKNEPSSSVKANLSAKITDIAETIILVSEETKMNPIDVLELSKDGIFGAIEEKYIAPRAEGKANTNTIAQSINRISAALERNTGAVVLSTLKKTMRVFNKSRIDVLRDVAGFLFVAMGSVTAFQVMKGAKPWNGLTRKTPKVNTRYGSYGVKNPVFGFEVVEFEYLVTDPESGKTVEATHTSAAVELERSSLIRNAQELVYAVQHYTCCGRLYLIYSDATRSLGLAADKKPGKKVYMAGDRNDALSIIYGAVVPQPLHGFVI